MIFCIKAYCRFCVSGAYLPCIRRHASAPLDYSTVLRGVDTGSTPVVPWIVAVSVLHSVRDVLFPRSTFLTRNRFLSLVKWLHETLKITVGYMCTRADDTRTTEIVLKQTSCCFLLGRALLCSRERWAAITIFALPATLSTASSLDGRRTTLQPNLSVVTCPTLYRRRLAPHQHWLVQNITRPVRIRKYIA